MEMCMGFGGGFAAQVGQSLVIPITRQFGYVLHYKRNMMKLRSEVEELEGKKNRVQEIVDEDRKNGCQIVASVEEWLSKVATIEKELQEFFRDAANKNMCLRGYCPNLVCRVSLSKRAKKWSSCVTTLMEEKFEVISHPAPLPKEKPAFIDNIKIGVQMRDFKKFPKVKGFRFGIPMLGVRVNVFN